MANNSSEKKLKKAIESIMKNAQYENFEEWVSNFSNNLSNIWNEQSLKRLIPNDTELQKNRTAIVIGRGPSIDKNKHLELLASSDFNGAVICCDGKLVDALKAGVTPDRFPKFFVVTIDPYFRTKRYYEDDIILKYGSKIEGIFSIVSHPTTVELARNKGIKINWVHSLLDYNEGIKSFNNISALMIRSKNKLHKLPAIQTGGNTGTAAWFIGWQILKCDEIVLIGINHGWNEEDGWEKIIFHGETEKEISEGVERNSKSFNKLYKKIYNPDFKTYCIVDPLFQFYSEGFKEFIQRSPKWLTTINATEGGSIFGSRIKSLKFSEYLKK